MVPEIQPPKRRRLVAILFIGCGLIGWILSFVFTIQSFGGLADAGASAATELVFGVPAVTFGIAVFVIPIAGGVAMFATARIDPASHGRRLVAAAAFLALFGIIGFWAAFALTADKVLVVLEPNPDLGCNFSLLVQCGANLESWQGSVLGFPNPLLGLAGWVAVLFVGVALLAGACFAPWFWITFNAGIVAALGFVIWLISQSIFSLGTLCPWCLVSWAVTIPLFWLVTLYNLKSGHFGAHKWWRRVGEVGYSWVPSITLASYIVVAVLAQLRLDVLAYL